MTDPHQAESDPVDPHPHQAESGEVDPEKQSTPAGVAGDLEEKAEEIGASTSPSPDEDFPSPT
jgi:hypothetical protein